MRVTCPGDGELSPGRKVLTLAVHSSHPAAAYRSLSSSMWQPSQQRRNSFMSENLSVFSAGYWRDALSELKKVNRLTLAALVIALTTAIGSLTIPVSQNLHIAFAFIVVAFGAMVYGPIVGAVAGAALDIVGFIAHPSGAFFPGYTLSAILSGMIYGLFLYRCRITVLRLLLVKAVINYGINVGLGCLWSALLIGKAYRFFFFTSLIKNTLMLPIEVILLWLTLQILLSVLDSAHLLPASQHSRRIPFI